MMTGLLLALTALGAGDLRDEADRALRRAVTFFSQKVTSHGGYVWRYSEDLSKREGEGEASETTAWTQPPGTATVGLAYLEAYSATGDQLHLNAVMATARALVRGQLRSGGWPHKIEFAAEDRRAYAFRTGPKLEDQKNWSTLDDDKTQSSLLFMIRVDRTLDFNDEPIHEATEYALNALLKAQFPNGGFPHKFDGPVTADPPRRASYPESWSRTMPERDYNVFPTLNDHLLFDLTPVLFEAARTYKDRRFRRAAIRVGDFLIGAQMPEPQPAWAQQYDFDMHPCWARKFEPPSITGGESQTAIRTLMMIYRETGDRKYLEPVPRALAYLRRSRLTGGMLARFYEFKSNRPLYFTRDYKLTYSDGDMPTHYGFKTPDYTDRIAKDLKRLKAMKVPAEKSRKIAKPSDKLVRRIIKALDGRGAWVEAGRLRRHDWDGRVIESDTFARNVGILSDYLAATR